MKLTKDLVGVAINISAANLVIDQAKQLDKSLKLKSSNKDMLKSSTKLITGTALLGATSDIANKL